MCGDKGVNERDPCQRLAVSGRCINCEIVGKRPWHSSMLVTHMSLPGLLSTMQSDTITAPRPTPSYPSFLFGKVSTLKNRIF